MNLHHFRAGFSELLRTDLRPNWSSLKFNRRLISLFVYIIDELPILHPHVHWQGSGRGAARAATTAAWQRTRRLPSRGDDATTGEEDSSATDWAPCRTLATASTCGGLLLPLELKLQVTATRHLRSLRPSSQSMCEWICTKASWVYFKYLYRNEIFCNERANMPFDNKYTNESTTSMSYTQSFFFYFTTIANDLRWSRSFHETEVFCSMILYANDGIRINKFFYKCIHSLGWTRPGNPCKNAFWFMRAIFHPFRTRRGVTFWFTTEGGERSLERSCASETKKRRKTRCTR